MIGLFNNRYTVSLLLATLFILGIGASIFFIYSLPHHLRLADGYQPVFFPAYIALIITFSVGVLALYFSMKYKKEVIVYKERILDATQSDRDGEQGSKTTISLDLVKTSLSEAKTEKEIFQTAMQSICKALDAGQGAYYKVIEEEGKRLLELTSGYALSMGESTVIRYEFGEGLIGQAAATTSTLYIDDVPDGYIRIVSGLGSASPKYLIIVPVKQQQLFGVLEIASFTTVDSNQRKFVEEAAQLIADKISPQA